jgi:HSP20 family protein
MSKITQLKKEPAPKEMTATRNPSMALTPFEDMERMFERFFEGFGPRAWLRPGRRDLPLWPEMLEPRLPRVDVLDQDEQVVVRAELPGVDKKDLEVSLGENTITLRATTHREEKEEKGDYVRSEIVRGELARTIPLPAMVDGEHAKASFRDGMLEVTMPKLEASKRRTITVE